MTPEVPHPNVELRSGVFLCAVIRGLSSLPQRCSPSIKPGKKKSAFLEPQALSPFTSHSQTSQEAIGSWNSCVFIVSLHRHFKAIERLPDNDLLILFAILGLFIHHCSVGCPTLSPLFRASTGPKYQEWERELVCKIGLMPSLSSRRAPCEMLAPAGLQLCSRARTLFLERVTCGAMSGSGL